MATKAAQVDELWDQPAKQPGSAAYMQANGVLQAYSAPKRQVRSAEPVTLNVLGVDFNWTHDGREFPAGVLAAIDGEADWNFRPRVGGNRGLGMGRHYLADAA